jgi:Sulfotransferase domain
MLIGHVELPLHVKETNFFNRYYANGIEWYARFFRHADPSRPVVEICPYFAAPHAPARVVEHIPECRAIVTLRDPVDRLYSHYRMMRGYAHTRVGLEETMRREPSLVEASRYAKHLDRWFRQLGRESVLVTFFTDLRNHPQGYLDSICDFIGISHIELADRPQPRDVISSFPCAPKSRRLAQNARHLRIRLFEMAFHRTNRVLARCGFWAWCAGRGECFPPLSLAQELRLREFYRPEVEALEEMLGRDLPQWKYPKSVINAGAGAEASLHCSGALEG